MKLQQLKLLCEVVDRGFSISRAAEALFTSQPGISRHLGVLEAELGVALLSRSRNKLVGLTPAGKLIVRQARMALDAVESIRRTSEDFRNPSFGSLTVSTTHTHARYVLAEVIQAFSRRHPKVTVKILQGLPGQIAESVRIGEADIGIATRPTTEVTDVAMVHGYDVEHILIAPPNHPCLRARKVSITDLAKYPLIGYDPSYQISGQVVEKFKEAGLTPNYVMRASDSDVIKTYVAAGLGIAIIPALAFDGKKERGLRSRRLDTLFQPTVACALLRKGLLPRAYMYDFLELLSPNLNRKAVDQAVFNSGAD